MIVMHFIDVRRSVGHMVRRFSGVVVLMAALVVYPLDPASAVAPFVVGATTSVNDTVGSGNTCAGFLDERTHLGPLAIRRVFTANGAPPPADAVNCQVLQGGTLWYSFKTSCAPAAVAAGSCDSEIQ